MPSIWRCRWPGLDGLDRHAVHRVLSRWLDTERHAQRKPWSWTADASDLLIGLLDNGLADRLVRGADAAGSPVRQVEAMSWAELRNGRDRNDWCLEFVSPVTFSVGGPGRCRGRGRSSWARVRIRIRTRPAARLHRCGCRARQHAELRVRPRGRVATRGPGSR